MRESEGGEKYDTPSKMCNMIDSEMVSEEKFMVVECECQTDPDVRIKEELGNLK